MNGMSKTNSALKYGAVALAVLATVALAGAGLNLGGKARAQQAAIAPGLILPQMNPENGKRLFASKGCVVCHQVNGIGGTDAAPLSADTMTPAMSPFDFFARMWLGAKPMIEMQDHELGGQIELTGQNLADIIAFVHNKTLQKTFSEKDIPEKIKALMKGDEDSDSKSGMKKMPEGRKGMMKR